MTTYQQQCLLGYLGYYIVLGVCTWTSARPEITITKISLEV